MARVTVEDCLDHVENRFKLVLLASKRARQLSMGTEPLVEWENDKPTVVALREIEHGLVNEEMMQASMAEPVEEELEFNEDDLAAALQAEITRELSQTVETTTPAETTSSNESDTATKADSLSETQNPFTTTESEASASSVEASSEESQPSPLETLLAQSLQAASEADNADIPQAPANSDADSDSENE